VALKLPKGAISYDGGLRESGTGQEDSQTLAQFTVNQA
jgi:hypothetical protein